MFPHQPPKHNHRVSWIQDRTSVVGRGGPARVAFEVEAWHWRGASLASVFDPDLSKRCCLVGSPTDQPIPFTQPGTVTFRMSLSWPIGSSPLRYCAWYWRDSGLPATRLARVST